MRIVKRDDREVHIMLKAFALEDQQFNEAIDQHKEAVRLPGGDAELKLSLAIALYLAGNKKEMQEACSDILY